MRDSLAAAPQLVVMTSEEAAAYLRIHVRTLIRRAALGELPAFRIGSHWRFLQSELDSWMRSELRSRQLIPVRSTGKESGS